MTAAAAQGPHRARYRRILSFASREFVAIWWFELVLPRFGLRGVAERTRARRMQRFARRFHALAVDLGGLMIKVGQFMSSRLDVLPPEITAELEGLQDEVPAVPTPQIRALAEAELGMPLERVYTWFDDTPVAAASSARCTAPASRRSMPRTPGSTRSWSRCSALASTRSSPSTSPPSAGSRGG